MLVMLSCSVVPYQYSTSNRNHNTPCLDVEALFLISILHQTATPAPLNKAEARLFLISILHQTATGLSRSASLRSCSLSVFYIKPQQLFIVVFSLMVVPYQYSTSNRNWGAARFARGMLFLISILHQTATVC